MDQLGDSEQCTVQGHKCCPQAPGLAPLKDLPRERETQQDSWQEELAGW